MTVEPQPYRRPGGVPSGSWPRAVLWLVILLGLVVMHQLAGGHRAGTPTPAAHCAEHRAEPPDAEDAGRAPGNPHGPADHNHGRPGQVCQPGKPSGGPAVPAPDPGVARVAPPAAAAVSPRTAVGGAAGGSGCGPPSRTELSIFRI